MPPSCKTAPDGPVVECLVTDTPPSNSLIVMIPAIYSISTYRRLAAYDDYHHPANAKSFGYADIEQQQLHQQQQQAGSRLSIGTLGANSLRRLSSGSMGGGNPNISASADVEPVPMSTIGRTPSYYSHERDTQFEKYMIERAMSSEFSNGGFHAGTSPGGTPGGGRSPGTHSPPHRSASTATDGSASSSALGVVVSSGSVNNARALRDSMGRTPSWGSSHVLVAVPEGDEDAADHHHHHHHHGGRTGSGGGDRYSMDREALLGPRSRAGSEGSDGPGGLMPQQQQPQPAGRFRDSAPPRGSFEELDLGDRKRKRDDM